MSKRTAIGLALIAGVAAMSYGAYRIIREQTKLLKSYCWKIKDVIIKKFNSDDVYLTFILFLKNQSNIDVSLTAFNFDVFLNNKKVAQVKNSSLDTKWKAKSVSQITFDVSFSPKQFFKGWKEAANLVLDALANPDNVLMRIKGSLSAKHAFIKVTDIPIDYEMSLGEIKDNTENEETYECTITEQDIKKS